VQEYQFHLWSVIRKNPDWNHVDVRIARRMRRRRYPLACIREVLMIGMPEAFTSKKNKEDYVARIMRKAGIQEFARQKTGSKQDRSRFRSLFPLFGAMLRCVCFLRLICCLQLSELFQTKAAQAEPFRLVLQCIKIHRKNTALVAFSLDNFRFIEIERHSFSP